ncbi:MAG: hypothetical protein QOG20_6692, partial [Pseudonocardiales bacterium]|nr:hypothetical protein [Pseudonocardiales bacterium]
MRVRVRPQDPGSKAVLAAGPILCGACGTEFTTTTTTDRDTEGEDGDG